MSTNPEIDETKILKIQTLKNEYDITLKQYQEAMKTYIILKFAMIKFGTIKVV